MQLILVMLLPWHLMPCLQACTTTPTLTAFVTWRLARPPSSLILSSSQNRSLTCKDLSLCFPRKWLGLRGRLGNLNPILPKLRENP